MNVKMIRYIISKMMGAEGLLMLLPMMVGIIYGEHTSVYFLITAAILTAIYLLFGRKCPENMTIYAKEGLIIVATAWIFWSLAGALPFVLSKSIPSYVDAFFETVSGFTTTGSTILTEIEGLPKGILFWRSLTHWVGVLLVTGILAGCGQSKKDDHLTVYLWENRLMKNIAPYIHEQFPDQDIEFIIGNNDTDLYSYFKEHGELPDIMTVRRFSGTDAQDLQPYLMDFASYDVVSKYYSYAVEYYKDTDDEIQWLPICAIPQTIIANKTLFDQYGIKVPENYEEYV